MKKAFIVSLLIIAALLLPVQSLAQVEEGTVSTKVEYNLPYPGMLPDSPLYFLKAFRDRVIATFISDSIKKAEFDLLQADKRLASGIALFEKGKKELAESTISKGENYFEDGIKNLELAKKQGKLNAGFLTSMELSAKKHLEILGDLKKESDGDLLKKIEVLEIRMQKYLAQVEQIKPQQ